MAKKVLEVVIQGKDAFSASAKAAGLSAEQTARKIEELNKANGTSKPKGPTRLERLDDGAKKLEQTFGEDRTINKLLQGGLVGFAGEKLAAVTGKAVELSRAFREGKESWESLSVKIGESIPIVGGFVTAGQNIRELFTHEKEDLDRINEKLKLQNQFLDVQKARLDRISEVNREIADITGKGASERRGLGLTGWAKEQFDAQSDTDTKRKAAQDKRLADIKKVDDEEKKALAEVDKQKAEGLLKTEEYERSKSALKREFEKRRKLEDKVGIEQEIQAYFTGQQKQGVLQRDAHFAAIKSEQQYAQSVQAIQAQSQADRLRSMGRNLEAELLLLREQGNDKKRVIQEQLKAQLNAAAPEDQAGLQAAAKRQIDAIDQASRDEAKNLAKRRQDDIKKALVQGQERALSEWVESAATGSEKLAATKALEHFKLRAAFSDRSKDLKNLLNDPSASPEEKQLALQQLQSCVGNTGRIFDQAAFGSQTAANHLAGASESLSLTGVGAAASERGASDLAKQQLSTSKEGTAVMKEFKVLFGDFYNLIKPKLGTGPQATPLFD